MSTLLPQLRDVAVVKSKYLEGREFELDDSYDIVLVTGSVCVNEGRVVELVREVRKRAKILVAFGSCAAFGGITLFCRGGQDPRPQHRTYQPISAVAEVDYAIPGCPPPPQAVVSLVSALMMGVEAPLKPFKAAAKVKKLSGFDLLDDIVLPDICIGCGTCYIRCPRASQLLVRRVMA